MAACRHTQATTVTLNNLHAVQGDSSTHHKGTGTPLTTALWMASAALTSTFLPSHALLCTCCRPATPEDLQKNTLSQTSTALRSTQTGKFVRCFPFFFGICMYNGTYMLFSELQTEAFA